MCFSHQNIESTDLHADYDVKIRSTQIVGHPAGFNQLLLGWYFDWISVRRETVSKAKTALNRFS